MASLAIFSHPLASLVLGAVATAVVLKVLGLFRKRERTGAAWAPVLAAPRKDVLYVFEFDQTPAADRKRGCVSYSPYCLKLHTYLRMRGERAIPFESVRGIGNMGRNPTGKYPFVQFNQEMVYDSSLIIDFLDRKFGALPDQERLTQEERARALVLARFVEDSVMPILAYCRWIKHFNLFRARSRMLAALPKFVADIIVTVVRAKAANSLWEAGVARFTQAELLAQLSGYLATLDKLLGDRPFFMGAVPTLVDCSVYGVVAQVVVSMEDDPDISRLVPASLVLYVERMRSRFFASEQ